MGVAAWFDGFCSNLVVQDRGTISIRYKAITNRLNSDFWGMQSSVSHSLYVGSYGRNTAIHGFSDLDMIFELPSALYWQYSQHTGNGQSSLLQAVRNSIKTTYPNTTVGGDGQVVAIAFSDGITFEVVPVFMNDVGSYTYPDSNAGGSWKTTNPRPEIEAIRSRSSSTNGNLVHLCRMARAWKRMWGVPVGGLLIDALAYQFIDSWSHKGKSYLYYDFMCRDFFGFLKSQNREQVYWRAPGSCQYVYGKGLFQYKATRCHNLALEAIECESSSPKREWSAKQKWREIFGNVFPS